MAGTWSYDPADVSTNEVDAIRLEVGDTDSQAWLLADEEIQFAIDNERNYWAAAARCAEMIGRLFMRKVDVRLGRTMQLSYSKTAEAYFKMASLLRGKAMGTVVPYVGGMSVTDKVLQASDPNIVAPLFTKTMMENPWTGGYDTDSLPPVGGNTGDSPIGES